MSNILNDGLNSPWGWTDGDGSHGGYALSEVGQARRDEILGELQTLVIHHGRVRRRNRRIAESIAVLSLVAIVTTAVWQVPLIRNGQNNQDTALQITESVTQTTPVKAITTGQWHIAIAPAQSAQIKKWTYRSQTDPLRFVVDDHSVLAILNSIGRPTGLIHTPHGVRFTEAVTDSELAESALQGYRKLIPRRPGPLHPTG